MSVGLYAAPLSLDPHLENEFLTSAVLANVFEGLTSLDGALRVDAGARRLLGHAGPLHLALPAAARRPLPGRAARHRP